MYTLRPIRIKSEYWNNNNNNKYIFMYLPMRSYTGYI